AAKIGPGKYITKISSAGPYVNFTFALTVVTEEVIKQVAKMKKTYGNSKTGEGKNVLVEYAQPNTHKEFHIGHVRNAVLGQAVVNVMEANGYKVIAASYIGDVGAHVAKALWGLKKFMSDEEIKDISKNERAKKLGEIYTKATQFVDEHEKAKLEIAEVQQKLEAGEEPWHKLWKETREWSLREFKSIFEELNVAPDVWYFESEVEKKGKVLVKKMLTKGIAKKSEGATVVDLADEDLGIFLILKSDGSSLYATKDLALAFEKDRKFDPDRQIFVVDVRQSLYFQQLFATLRKLEYTKKLTHLAYDMVNLPEGAISSRSGNIVRYEDVRDAMVLKLVEETQKRHEDWKEKEVTEVAKTIALGSMIFMMLRQDPKSIITFDMEEALSFEGFTGPYLLYTIARIESIKKKAGMKSKVEAKLLTNRLEHELIRRLANYPDLVQDVGAHFQVSSIAQWAFDTAKLFAEYYHEIQIIDEKNQELTQARLALAESVGQVLKNSMHLLGIDVLEEM
ncbi:MAG: arginine--tRNA ligase, partial [Patescibacteria group bacterium]